ncbi:hypothetical protein BQ8482_111774 [Mesorhizobium delmotii]|uniref:Uncharacterized protein n=1 Tax=Mesorhizobium delmotii TaxID=1631247 RepID=A0A2P9AFE9_9HYPH|nr:hypothetical protein BQ8482_111774 [Mesorhizobium delmotii]
MKNMSSEVNIEVLRIVMAPELTKSSYFVFDLFDAIKRIGLMYPSWWRSRKYFRRTRSSNVTIAP